MKQLTSIYLYFSLLNLDVVVGALGFVFVAEALYPVHIPIYQVLILATTVWMIYSADRLMDAFRNPLIKTIRHNFQFKYRKLSLIVLCCSVFFNGWMLLLYKPIKLIIGGLLLAVFMIVYFLLKQFLITQKKWFPFKEVFIALGYSTGIMLLPISNCNNWSIVWVLLWGYIFIVALINVVVIGSFEKHDDWLQGEKTMIHLIRPRWEKVLCVLLSMMALLLVFIMHTVHPVCKALIVVPIALLIPLFLRKKFSSKLRYRLWEDGVLMLPVPILIFDSILHF